MNLPTSSLRLLLAGLLTLVAACCLAASAQAAVAPPVPKDIAVPTGHKAYLDAHAVGVQIYSCNGTAWTLVAPRADLYDRRGRRIGTHFAGPSWRAEDGSTVVGTRVAGVNVDPTAIDWLLISAAPAPDSPRGTLSRTTYIQRINTTGGRPPASGTCTATGTGSSAEVPYTADYRFWRAKGRRTG